MRIHPEPTSPPPSLPATLAVETIGLVREFGAFRAVDALNLAVPAGCFYGFLGPNGAGKSTTIKMLTGLLQPTSGEVRILGLDVSQPEHSLAAKQRTGVVPENLALFENLTAAEYLTFVGRMYQMPLATVKQRSEELLEMMGLHEQHKKLCGEFSHGMKKKLALAAAIIARPDLLFLDEPFEGVDAVSSRMLKEVLHQFTARGGTVFLTSHVLEIVEKLCTDVAIISQGKLVVSGRLAELRGDGSLEECFLTAVGGHDAATSKLSWLD